MAGFISLRNLGNVKFLNNDLLLLDRGYPSIALMYIFEQKRIDFCVRLKGDWWKEGQAMLHNDEKDKTVTFTLPLKDRHLQKEYLVASPNITCRLIVIELETGEKEVLCTSLCNRKKYRYDCFKELYHYRKYFQDFHLTAVTYAWRTKRGYLLLDNLLLLIYY